MKRLVRLVRKKKHGGGMRKSRKQWRTGRRRKETEFLIVAKKLLENIRKRTKKQIKKLLLLKNEAYKELQESLKGAEGEKKAVRIAKQRNRESQDMYQANFIKNSRGNALMGGGRNKEKMEGLF